MNLERRIFQLERRCARLQKTFGIFAVTAVAVFLIGAKAKDVAIFDSVEAREFVLKDNNGKGRAYLVTGRNGEPGFVLNDDKGKRRLLANLNGFYLYDKNGQRRVRLFISGNGNPSIQFKGQRGNSFASLGILRENPTFVMTDRADIPRISMNISSRGDAGIFLTDNTNKKPRVGLLVNSKKNAEIFVNDPSGKNKWRARDR